MSQFAETIYRLAETVLGTAVFALDGSGYPFHLRAKDLALGSRIMAVADGFAALTEDRPCRKGMSAEAALAIISRMAMNNGLDKDIVDLLQTNLQEVYNYRSLEVLQDSKYYLNLVEGQFIHKRV